MHTVGDHMLNYSKINKTCAVHIDMLSFENVMSDLFSLEKSFNDLFLKKEKLDLANFKSKYVFSFNPNA